MRRIITIPKKFRFILGLMLYITTVKGQLTCYDNFEGIKFLSYREKTGVLDTAAINPLPMEADSSLKCAMYIRNSAKRFDNIKMSLWGKLSGVESYATYLGIPPQITMKLYSTAPEGTLVEILLGSKGRNNEYPAGTHSQYQAYTTVSNRWEVLQFKFSQVPKGSETSATDIDQVTLLFNPNSTTSHTYYFDEITGPSIVPVKLGIGGPTVGTPKENKK